MNALQPGLQGEASKPADRFAIYTNKYVFFYEFRS